MTDERSEARTVFRAQETLERVEVDFRVIELVQVRRLATNQWGQMHAAAQRVTARTNRFDALEDDIVGKPEFAQ
jgi:hypothetical protein